VDGGGDVFGGSRRTVDTEDLISNYLFLS